MRGRGEEVSFFRVSSTRAVAGVRCVEVARNGRDAWRTAHGDRARIKYSRLRRVSTRPRRLRASVCECC